MDAKTWLWGTAIVMAAGAGAILIQGGRCTAAEQAHAIPHVVMCLIAACAYAAMAIG